MRVREIQYEIDNPYNRQMRIFNCLSWEDYIKKLDHGTAGISQKSMSSFILLNDNIKFSIIGTFIMQKRHFIHIAYYL